MTRSERRDALLDSAVALVTSGDIHDVSMETVAEMAGVSRPLVYKHFANRDELLAAVYTREATSLHEELAAEVAGAETVEEMYRTLIRGSLRAAAARGHVFAALRAAGGWSREVREEQHSRDRETVRAFSARAAREYHLDRRLAAAVCAALLGAIDSLLAQWRVRPTSEHALVLEDVYMGMVAGGFAAVGAESSVMSSS
ncbi:MAG TPA: TetR/AcrR family transcriptional regulator [Acidimicrobiales bacterium]|nr:TetR/AcrR family transcriptional regulator [Acidimicrobiales bacterium]